jgi:hypothetical protein
MRGGSLSVMRMHAWVADQTKQHAADNEHCWARFFTRGAVVRLLLSRKTISWFFGGLTELRDKSQLQDGLPTRPRVTLTAQDEYVIRENLLTDSSGDLHGSIPAVSALPKVAKDGGKELLSA